MENSSIGSTEVHNQGTNLNHDERQLAEWVSKRFPTEKGRIMKIFSITKEIIDTTKTVEKAKTTASARKQTITTKLKQCRSINT